MQNLLTTLVPSTEAVGIDTVIFKMLTVVMEQLKTGSMEMVDANKALMDIYKPSGVNVHMELLNQSGMGAFIKVPVLNEDAVLQNGHGRGYTKNPEAMAIFGTKDITFAGIDRTRGKLSGLYSKIPFVLYLTPAAIEHLSAQQLAAVTLHEIGHVWSYCEFLTTGIVTNQALKTARDAFLSNNTEEKIKLLRLVGDEGVSYAQIDGMDEKQYLTQIGVRVSQKLDIARAQTASSWYDRSSFEYLADQYATRHGAGGHLVSALEILRRDVMYETYYSSKIGAVLASGTKLLAAGLWAMIPFSPLVLLYLGLWGNTPVVDQSGIYDLAPDRYRRIIQSSIAVLKDRKVDPELRRSTLADIVVIEKVIDSLNSSINITKFMRYLLRGSFRRSLQEKRHQQELEALANNDLYRQSASLLN